MGISYTCYLEIMEKRNRNIINYSCMDIWLASYRRFMIILANVILSIPVGCYFIYIFAQMSPIDLFYIIMKVTKNISLFKALLTLEVSSKLQ